MGNDIHKTHFTVPEMPWREKEKQAIYFTKMLLDLINRAEIIESINWYPVIYFIEENKDLIDWIMKYKGE